MRVQRRHVHAARLAARVRPNVRQLSRGRGGRAAVLIAVPVPIRARSPRVAREPGKRPVGTVRDPPSHRVRHLDRAWRDHHRAGARSGRAYADRDRHAPGSAAGCRSLPAGTVAVSLVWALVAKPLMRTLVVVGVLPGTVRALHYVVRHLLLSGGDTTAL